MLKWINKKRNQKGFTLVELVVVIAILGVLAALAIPRLTGSRANAERKAIVASLRTIDSAAAIAEANGETVTNLASLVSLGHLAAEPKSNNATITIKQVGTPTTWRGVVSLTADQAKVLDVGDAVITDQTVEGLQSNATHGSKWK